MRKPICLFIICFACLTAQAQPRLSAENVEAVLQAVPETHLDLERGWRCITKIWGLTITTHQYHHPIFLPEWLRKETMRG